MTKDKEHSISRHLLDSEASELNVAQLPNSEKELGGFPSRLQQVVGERSVRSFASDCGMSDTVVRQYLSGKSEPTRPAIIAIARVSGCSIDWLMTGEGKMRRGEAAPEPPCGEKPQRYTIDASPDLMAQVQERLSACIAKYGVALPVEKTINLTVTSVRIFDGNYKDLEFREKVMDSVIDNLVRLALPEK
ncbi:MAG: helix-turn-helix transcriptional regulator [Geobacter sp.]|nr:helix-turn-helix transcriptional regulator [Geobacter sp.]